ncbi:MAG: hypothetical protein Q9224_004713, partial [Gallowayella concinna]
EKKKKGKKNKDGAASAESKKPSKKDKKKASEAPTSTGSVTGASPTSGLKNRDLKARIEEVEDD